MLKVLIICKENQTAKKIINNVLINIDNLRIMGIANSVEEAQELVIKLQPELIISMNSEIVDLIREKFIAYRPGIVIISNSKLSKKNIKNVLYISKNLGFLEIAQKINIFINRTVVCSQKEKIINLLSRLGFTFNLAGTMYLLDAILYTHTYQGSYSFEKLSKDLYSYVADLNNTTADKVKWSIARSINYMYDKHTKESYKIVESFFKIKYPERPTPKSIINLLSNNLDF